MKPLRRTQHEARIEIMPMIDVIFLLLTFFIYAMVVMRPIELLQMQLQEYASGEPAEQGPTATISLMLDGSIHYNREPIEIDDVRDRIRSERITNPDTTVVLALEEGEGDADRAPILTALLDRLRNEGLDIQFVGMSTAARAAEP